VTITVIGLGKIGLPLAVQFARNGEQVLGVDINQDTVDLVNAGLEPFPGEAGLRELLAEVVGKKSLIASTSTRDSVSRSDVVVVVVPLFVDSDAKPDFRAMDSATREIALGINRGTLVAYETTLPVGTTRERFTRSIEEISGYKVGKDFNVVFSPERVLTGRVFSDLKRYPKIVGGVTPECSKRGRKFYEGILDFDLREDLQTPNGVWMMDTSEAAEFVKLAETTYRDVNIGLANQFAIYAQKINVDIHQVIQAANSQVFSHIHQPGIAVGGHCIPIYPQFYLWNDQAATIVREARKTNVEMPANSISRLIDEYGDLEGKNVAILGATYRAGVKETAFSGVFDLYKILNSLKAKVFVHDFLLEDSEIAELGWQALANFEEVEIAIIQNNDSRYVDLLGEHDKFTCLRIVLDGRNLLNGVPPNPQVRLVSV
jgi:nucleotide sugar dehydrogenase